MHAPCTYACCRVTAGIRSIDPLWGACCTTHCGWSCTLLSTCKARVASCCIASIHHVTCTFMIASRRMCTVVGRDDIGRVRPLSYVFADMKLQISWSCMYSCTHTVHGQLLCRIVQTSSRPMMIYYDHGQFKHIFFSLLFYLKGEVLFLYYTY